MAKAETQSEFLRKLFLLSDSNEDSFEFTRKEKDILRNGRNRASRGPLRVSQQVYSEGSALETLIGYLYLSDRFRLQEVLNMISSLKQSSKNSEKIPSTHNEKKKIKWH